MIVEKTIDLVLDINSEIGKMEAFFKNFETDKFDVIFNEASGF